MRTKSFRASNGQISAGLAVAAAVVGLALTPLVAHAAEPDPTSANSLSPVPGAREGAALQVSRFKTQTNRADLIADQAMAIGIARIILRSVYGKAVIDKEEPLKCELRDGVWIIEGTFNHKNEIGKPPWKGGVAYIYILKRTGEVLDIYHTE